mgnify:CR=1 FL=1
MRSLNKCTLGVSNMNYRYRIPFKTENEARDYAATQPTWIVVRVDNFAWSTTNGRWYVTFTESV